MAPFDGRGGPYRRSSAIIRSRSRSPYQCLCSKHCRDRGNSLQPSMTVEWSVLDATAEDRQLKELNASRWALIPQGLRSDVDRNA